MSLVQQVRRRLWEVLTPQPVRQLLESTLTQLYEPGWTMLGTGLSGVEDDPIRRRDALLASYYYWQRDPLYGRAVRLTRNYTFGRGISWKADDLTVSAAINRFWDDPDNRLFTRAMGQSELAERLVLAGVDSPEEAACLSCGGTVKKRKRR